MIEPLIEGGGCIVGLALLYYSQVWRPARKAARDHAAAQASQPVTPAAPDVNLGPASEPDRLP